MAEKVSLKDKNLPLMLRRVKTEHPNAPAHYFRVKKNADFQSESYTEFYQNVLDTAAGFMECGVKRGDFVLLISDNRYQWQWASLALLSLGAIDVPRGSDATVNDIENILSLVDCRFAILENKFQVQKIISLIEKIPQLEKIIVFESFDLHALQEKFPQLSFISFDDLKDSGKNLYARKVFDPEAEMDKTQLDDIAAIIFTSGTTGIPKGVMLSHRNFLVQIPEVSKRIHMTVHTRAFAVLPIWHSFQREVEYITMYTGSSIVYSKPIPSVLMPDIKEMEPHCFPSVPRIWEAIYDAIYKKMKRAGGISFAVFRAAFFVGEFWKRQELKLFGHSLQTKPYQKITHPLTALIPVIVLSPLFFLFDILVFKKIREQFGKNWNNVGGIAGGGALPRKMDIFFATAGIKILEGYGITELSPVVAVRAPEKQIQGTVGKPIACLDVKICDEQARELPCGNIGCIYLRGPSVMAGYFKNPEKTAEVLDADGWFNTGDLGMLTLSGELVLTGRAKDTIVLLGGENIEPVPIEMKLEESPYIKTAMVVGQDQRYLASLVLIDAEALKMWADENQLSYQSLEMLVQVPEVQNLYSEEINSLISAKNNFKIFERISRFKLLTKDFEVGKELSIKLDIARHKINKLYEEEIKELFNK